MAYSIDDESRTCSEFSPGPVEHAENILRVMHNPIDYEDQYVKPNAIPIRDLATRGVSTFRRAHVNHDSIITLAENQRLKLPDERRSYAVFLLLVETIRALVDDDEIRMFIVIDKALETDPSHACIYSAVSRSDSKLREIRNVLLDHLVETIDLHDI